jgi:hypothetical protein
MRYWASLPSIMVIHSAPVIDCDQRTVLKTGRSIQPESQIDAADPNRGICATECCMIAVGYVFWLLENDESMGFFRSFFCGMMFEFSGKRSERQAAQNGAKNHIGRPNRRGSSRTGFRDSCRPGARGICSQGPEGRGRESRRAVQPS